MFSTSQNLASQMNLFAADEKQIGKQTLAAFMRITHAARLLIRTHACVLFLLEMISISTKSTERDVNKAKRNNRRSLLKVLY